MSFESVDNKGERSWEPASSKMNIQPPLSGRKEKQQLQALLAHLQECPKGAYSLDERFKLYAFDPTTYSAYPKKLSATNLKTLETYVLFDTVLNQVFFSPAPLGDNGMRALQTHIQDQLDIPIEWVPVHESNWVELHDELTQHIQVLGNERIKDEKTRRNTQPSETSSDAQTSDAQTSGAQTSDTQTSDTQTSDAEIHNIEVALAEAKKRAAEEEEKRNKNTVTFTEFKKFFDAICLKISHLDEKYEQMLEEESRADSDKRRDFIKTKELLKEAIKFEVDQQRIVVEEMKKENLD